MNQSKDRNSSLTVQQSNNLIKSRHVLTVNEKKLIHIGIASSKAHQFYDRVELHEDDIKKHLGLTNAKGFSSDLKKLSTKLMSRVIDLPKDNGGFEQCHWVHHPKYDPQTKIFLVFLRLNLLR